ncbi:hypothetical protein FRB96_007598 [Tulasnella sp. 330]|nr:hypothetical protein FRB96_007598 [Tulasnella sp. 330]KAG8889141.1 hypothetical protein FRB98_005616 [Tulasnella sp. 332]
MSYHRPTTGGGAYPPQSGGGWEDQRPGTASGGGGQRLGQQQQPQGNQRPTTSGQGQPGQAIQEEEYEEEYDDEEYEESEDEDVFAYLPPNTAQGQQLQQLQNAQAARARQYQHQHQMPTLPEGGGAFAFSYPNDAPTTGTDSARGAQYSTGPATPASSVPLGVISGRYAHHQQPPSTVYSMASTPPVTASTVPPFAYDSAMYGNNNSNASGSRFQEQYDMTPISTAATVPTTGIGFNNSTNYEQPPSSMASSHYTTHSNNQNGERSAGAGAQGRRSQDIHLVSLPTSKQQHQQRDVIPDSKSSDYDGNDDDQYPIGASTTWANHGRNRSLGGEGDLGLADADGLRYRPDSKRTKTASSDYSAAGESLRSKTEMSLSNVPYASTLPSSGGGGQNNENMYDLDEDGEDSPYPEVRASVSNVDDPEMPVTTFRMWFIGIMLCALGSGLNMFFNFRYPAPYVAPLLLLLLAHPAGKFLAFVLPIRVWTLWPWIPVIGGQDVSLNPGPFNIKEHALIFIMANVSINPAYAMNVIVVSEKYYEYQLGFSFTILLILATQLTGFGLSGACRRFLVWPASLIWPANLVTCTLLNTLHAEDDEVEEGSGITRYKFFMIATSLVFVWYFVPGFLFQALSAFSFICWIKPNNIVVNQLFGVMSGLGMGILTFDWNQISYIGSPLMVPWWAEVHIFVGFVLFYWILCPLMYYNNVWSMSYIPMSGNGPFDNQGDPYNVSRVITADMRLNVTAYNEYSPLYLPATYAITYILAFMLSTSVLVHTALYHGKALTNGIKKLKMEEDDIHAKLMRNYPEVPDWWYALIFVGFFVLAIVAVQIGKTDMPVWALFLAILIPIIYVIPSSYIFAMTGQPVGVNLIAEVIPGSLLQGRPIANMIFKCYSVQTMQVALAFTQDLKLGHYMKVPPRATFLCQAVATIIAGIVQVGTKTWMFDNIPDLCSPDQPHMLTCPTNEVYFAASAVWGLIGPTRQFGSGTVYHPELYALAVGAFLPIPFWIWQKKWPNSVVKYVNIPVLLNGPTFIPPATGINYSSWFGVGLIFQYIVRRRNFRWWSKFNYILSASLDSGTIISVIVVFATLQYPKGGTIALDWWGNSVFLKTADALGLPWKTPPPGGF